MGQQDASVIVDIPFSVKHYTRRVYIITTVIQVVSLEKESMNDCGYAQWISVYFGDPEVKVRSCWTSGFARSRISVAPRLTSLPVQFLQKFRLRHPIHKTKRTVLRVNQARFGTIDDKIDV